MRLSRFTDWLWFDVIGHFRPFALKSFILDSMKSLGKSMSSSTVMMMSSSSRNGRIGNTFFMDFVLSSTQFRTTLSDVMTRWYKSFGRLSSQFGNSSWERVRNILSGRTVFSSTEFITDAQFLILFGYDVRAMFMVDM